MAALAVLAATPALAQIGEKPIRIVVPYGAGGGIDAAARGLAKGIGQDLGRVVVVENKPGGNSVIGAQAVVSSPSDGLTFLFTSGSTVSVLPHISKSLPFDPQKDLEPVGKVAKMPFVVLVNKTVGTKDMKQFIDRARAEPGKLTYASAGSGTGSHLGFELLKKDAGINVRHVPYKATSEALPDLFTGRVDAMMADPQTAQRCLKEGSVQALAVTTSDRSPGFPGVPTVSETGVKGFDLELWMALFAPRGTSPETVARIDKAMKSYLESPAGKSAFDDLGFTPDYRSPQELQSLVTRESERWAALAKTGALKIE